MIDIIIPVFNEEKILQEKRSYYEKLSSKAHILFVDGGSHDTTIEIAKNYGKVVQAQKGRSIQKNFGAEVAQNDYLLFLNVDTQIDFKSLPLIENLLSHGKKSGCFTLKIADKRFIFRVFEELVNFIADKFQLVDADLGLFISKADFNTLGGFDNVALMEDILFGKKLTKIMELTILEETITTSARKWDKHGFLQIFKDYTNAYIDYFLGTIKPLKQEP